MKKIYSVAAALLLASVGINVQAQEKVPFVHTFDNPNSLDGWTTDLGNVPFKYFTAGASPFGGCPKPGAGSRYITSTSQFASKNSWLISPAISLEAGKPYKVKYTLAAQSFTVSMFKIWCGTEAKLDAMTTFVTEYADEYGPGFFGDGFASEANFVTFEGELTPESSGDYYIGFVDDTDRHSAAHVIVFDFSVTSAASGSMPAEPTDFTVTPSAVGALSVKLSAKAPSVDVAGSALESLTALEFLRDDVVIETVSNPVKGQIYTYTDNSPVNGNNTYAVRAVNVDGVSNLVSKKVKVGLEIPQALTDVNAGQISSGSVKFSWVKPIGDIFQTMFQDLSLVTTKIVITKNGAAVKTLDNVQGTETVVDLGAADQEQTFYDAQLYAVTTGGESLPVSVTFPVGKIASLPYSENFADGKVHNPFCVGNIRYGGAWEYMVNDDKQGVARFSANASSGAATLFSGTIAIPADSHELLSFKYVSSANSSDHTLAVLINDEGKWVEVESYKVSGTGWKNAAIDLSAYAGKNIQYALRGILGIGSYNFSVADIKIGSAKEYDLGLDGLSFPSSMERGLPVEATVTVKNFGTKAVDGCTVKLYRDNSLVDAKTCTKLEPWASETVVFELVADRQTPSQVTYYVEIEYAADQDATNNTSLKMPVEVVTPPLYPATNVQVEMSGNETVVTLKWDAPEGADPESPSSYRKLLGYRVVRNSVAVSAELIQGCEYVDANLAPGTYTYTVAAVYEAGYATATSPVTATVKDGSQVGIDSIVADEFDRNAVYYDILGRRIVKPVSGSLYIKVVNGKAQRVIVK